MPSGIWKAPLLCSTISWLVMIAKIASSTWPAVMLAKSRTASEKGRTNTFDTNSIGVTRR